MTKPCMVVFDDEQGLCAPMGWDTYCDGALCHGGKPVVFPNRAAARKAINVSRAFAQIARDQGRYYNSEFLEAIKHIKIVSVVMARADE